MDSAPPHRRAPAPDVLERTLTAFFAAIAGISPPRIAALFAADGEIEDPIGSDICRGRANIEKYFADGLASLVASAEIDTLAIIPSGDRVAAHWKMRATGTSGLQASAEGIDVLVVSPSGEIIRAEGYWDAASFVQALRPR